MLSVRGHAGPDLSSAVKRLRHRGPDDEIYKL
jgi:hypothetical protein